jgi:hypothetical protein
MSSLTDPIDHADPITPHDDNDLANVTRGLYVGVAGDVAVHMADGDAVTFTALSAGVFHPIRVKRVLATGTAATNVVGGW